MIIIGKGTDPNLNNDTTIAFDKLVLDSLRNNVPPDGYTAQELAGQQEIQDRIDAYEAQHGTVDPAAVQAKAAAEHQAMATILGNMAASAGGPGPLGAAMLGAGGLVGMSASPAQIAALQGSVKSVQIAPPPRRGNVTGGPQRPKQPPALPMPQADLNTVHVVRLVECDGNTMIMLVNSATYDFIQNGGAMPRPQLAKQMAEALAADAKTNGAVQAVAELQNQWLQFIKNPGNYDADDRARMVVGDDFNGEEFHTYGTVAGVMTFVAKHGLSLSPEEHECLAL